MGKKKVTDKDIRSIEFAIDRVFSGASGEAAKQAFYSLVERAEETGKLQNDLNSLRREFNTLKGEYKKVSHRFSNFRKLCHAMARKEIVDADGEPILFGDILYGEDGRAWTVLGPSSKRWLFVSGMNVDGEPVKQLVMTKWLTRTPCKAEEK